MTEQLLTMEDAKKYFNVKDNRTIAKFIRQGLKVFKVGTRDYRFRKLDLEEFTQHQIEVEQEQLMQINPIRRKAKCKTVNIDYEKKKINLQLNKVV